MNKGLLIFMCLLIFFGCDNSENIDVPFKSSFIRMYGDAGEHAGVAMTVKDNDIYLLSQRTFGGRQQAYVVKTDAEGNQLWDIVLGATVNYFAKDIIVDNIGRICVALDFQADASSTDVRIIRLQDNGSSAAKIDSVSIGVPNENDNVNSIRAVSDGTYMILGRTFPVNFNLNPDINTINFAFWRTDANLNILDPNIWTPVIGTSDFDDCITVFEGSAHPFFVVGSTNATNVPGVENRPQSINFFAVGINNNGSNIGPIATGNDFQNLLRAAKENPFTGTGLKQFLLIGTSNNLGTNIIDQAEVAGDIFISQLLEEPTGFKLRFVNPKALNIGTNLIPKDIAFSQSGGSVLCADEQVLGRGINAVVARLDVNGGLIWRKSIGTVGNYKAARIIELNDGRIIVVGTAGLINHNKMMLIKINQDGQFLP